MRVFLVGLALDMLDPEVARKRLRLVGKGALVLLYVWVRAVIAGDAAREARLSARRTREVRTRERMAARRRSVERSVDQSTSAGSGPLS